jgi:predicted rRNA methylase YqxC with S4 and FtsJ domains
MENRLIPYSVHLPEHIFLKIKAAAEVNNLKYIEHIESPILGGDGNQEFLMLLQKI